MLCFLSALLALALLISKIFEHALALAILEDFLLGAGDTSAILSLDGILLLALALPCLLLELLAIWTNYALLLKLLGCLHAPALPLPDFFIRTTLLASALDLLKPRQTLEEILFLAFTYSFRDFP